MSRLEETISKHNGLICLSRWFETRRQRPSSNHTHCHAPKTTSVRLSASLSDMPLDTSNLTQYFTSSTKKPKKTVLYLAYGSNLCHQTFRERRGIRPVSQINVVVPQLVMTFSLPGFPYTEPCFANTADRQMQGDEYRAMTAEKERYDKEAWGKGLVGVVYEVTMADYAHIIATEGGGGSYQDVLVDCYSLSNDPSTPVPITPTGSSFKAHTLFVPTALASKGGRPTRPDPGYAQPSPRYLKLITDGASELALPYEYQDYLHAIHTYHITTLKQQLGQFIFWSIWAPLLAFVVGAGRLFADKNGRYPPWLTTLVANIFIGMWSSYDSFFKGLFGDGERTMEPSSHHFRGEKEPLVSIESV